jgi:hypothetical protein
VASEGGCLMPDGGLEDSEKLLTATGRQECSGSGDAGQVGFTGSLTVSGDA